MSQKYATYVRFQKQPTLPGVPQDATTRRGLTMWRRLGLVLAQPGLRRLLATAVSARLPLGMWSLAIVLFVRDRTHSFAVVGLSVGVYAAATAVASPLLGISVDRLGRGPVLLATGGGGHRALGLGLVAVAGASVPPVSVCLRSLWLELVPPTSSGTVHALDAVPSGRATESFTWNTSAIIAGLATGATLAGALSDAVASGAVFVMACGLGLSAALFLVFARDAVAPPSAAGRELALGVPLD
jgi:MFS family permease